MRQRVKNPEVHIMSILHCRALHTEVGINIFLIPICRITPSKTDIDVIDNLYPLTNKFVMQS